MKLGYPIPNDPHAVSVSLPHWADVKGYEEDDARVVQAMQLGYPRFVYHPLIKELAGKLEAEFAGSDEVCLPLPSEKYARACIAYCGADRVETWQGIAAVVLPRGLETKAKEFWTHAGFIVSSRLAEHVLHGGSFARDDAAEKTIRQRLSNLSGAVADDIYLYPSGMAAIFNAFEAVGSGKTIQLGFPYVDTFKIQQKFGEGIFIDYDPAAFASALKEHRPSAVFTEFPLNPLLTVIDLKEVNRICRANGAVLVVDDTLSTWANTDVLRDADITVTSLTKFFSGVGNVTAGSTILNAQSPYYTKLKTAMRALYEPLLFAGDAKVLEANSRDFDARMASINLNAEQLFDWLSTQPAFQSREAKIYYTKGNPTYEAYKKQGYGGVLSLDLGSEEKARRFYDAIDIAKGPSLGTNYTLATAYTMLAHYHEREFAEASKVPFHLIRVSVGMEDIEELKRLFAAALAA